MKKIALILAVLISTTLVKAQDSIRFDFSFNHMALSVKDLGRSATFYMNLFQLKEITNRSKIEGIRWLSLGEGKELHLISIIKENVTANKALHLALTTQNFDAFLKRLQTMNIAYSNWPGTASAINRRADGVKQVYFQDPDGYWIEVNNGYAAPLSMQQSKDTVWHLEEKYWTYVKTQDLKSYATLWDDQFIGYPSNNKIAGKDHITDWITDMFKDKSRHFDYRLDRKVENVFGDIVIVLYDVTETWTNNKNEVLEKTTYKITHTWKKTDNGWLIIGGMGANKK
ncbi:DUF4440 domain-containing protein [Panacibacter ginsenosidivorans]|uniref:DUF4440 domain-containing protein n=1 Tax=Panacibacter ginsenosidivorans TaxID=1813871 RepID=A0A5B8V8Q0_9BACT|nr:DUF4440 domain-containing protein [Panacibacter ginsenosidivorans]QEC67086.1 DUF4440 domain-containing protein [Panacibacter ginsenosidivorans]